MPHPKPPSLPYLRPYKSPCSLRQIFTVHTTVLLHHVVLACGEGKRRDRGCSLYSSWGVQSPLRDCFPSNTSATLRRWRRKRSRHWRRERSRWNFAKLPNTPLWDSLHFMEMSVVFTALFTPARPTLTALCVRTVQPKLISTRGRLLHQGSSHTPQTPVNSTSCPTAAQTHRHTHTRARTRACNTHTHTHTRAHAHDIRNKRASAKTRVAVKKACLHRFSSGTVSTKAWPLSSCARRLTVVQDVRR